MKKLILILSVILLISCSSDDDSSNNNNMFGDIETVLVKGTWKVSYFFDEGADNTAEFQSFNFTFKENDEVQAATDLFTEVGVWTYNRNTGNSSNDEELFIEFTNAAFISDLSEDWDIKSVSDTKVELEKSSDSPANEKFLTFTKN